jgi:putative flippase GtrA
MVKTKAQQKRRKKLIIQFVEYMISGGAYFWSGSLVFFAFDKGLHASLFWAKLVSNLAGWTVNYTLQRYWVFKNPHLKDHLAKTNGRYIFITLVDFLLDYLIVAGLKSAGLTPYLGQFASAGFFTVWNYLWYRFWVFPETHKKGVRPRRKR